MGSIGGHKDCICNLVLLIIKNNKRAAAEYKGTQIATTNRKTTVQKLVGTQWQMIKWYAVTILYNTILDVFLLL